MILLEEVMQQWTEKNGKRPIGRGGGAESDRFFLGNLISLWTC